MPFKKSHNSFDPKISKMKKLILIPTIGLSATYILKAQGVNIKRYEPVEISSKSLNDTLAFNEYCGTYSMQENPYIDEVTLRLKNGKLVSLTPEGEEVILENTAKDEFFVPEFSLKVVFIRDSDKIKGLKVKVQGQEILGERH